MKVDVFISCSTRDIETGTAICEALETNDVSVWSPLSLKSGDKSQVPSIGRVLVLVFSPHAATSPRIAHEVNFAITNNLPIITLAVGDAEPIAPFSRLAGTQHWHQAPGKSIADSLNKLVYSVTMTLARMDLGASVNTMLRDEPTDSTKEKSKTNRGKPSSVKLPEPARPKVKAPRPPAGQVTRQWSLAAPPGAREKLPEKGPQPPRPESPMQTRAEPNELPVSSESIQNADTGVVEAVSDTPIDIASDAPPLDAEVIEAKVVELDLADETPQPVPEGDFATEIANEIVDEVVEATATTDTPALSGEIELVLDDEPATLAVAAQPQAPDDDGIIDLTNVGAQSEPPIEVDTTSQEIQVTLATTNSDTAQLQAQQVPEDVTPKSQDLQGAPGAPGMPEEPQPISDQQESVVKSLEEQAVDAQTPVVATTKNKSTRVLVITSICIVAVLAIGYVTLFKGDGSEPAASQSIISAPKTIAPTEQPAKPTPAISKPVQEDRTPDRPTIVRKPTPKPVAVEPKPILPKQNVPAVRRSSEMIDATKTAAPTSTTTTARPSTPLKATSTPGITTPKKIEISAPSDLAIAAARLEAAGRKQYNTAMKAFRQEIDRRAAGAREMVTAAKLNTEKNRQDFEGQIGLGKALVQAQEYHRAIQLLDNVIRADPDSANAYLHRGEAHLGLTAYDAAINDFKRVLATRPREMLAYLGLGNAYRGKKDMEESANQFKTATRMRYTDPMPFVEYGRTLIALGQYDQATQALKRAIHLNRRYAPAYVARGQMLLAQGNRQGAIRALTTALVADNQYAPAYAHRGKAYIEDWSFAHATADLTTATALNPKDIDSYVLLAEALLELNDTSQALSIADQALSLDPMSAPAHTARANVLMVHGWYAYAMEHANWAVHLDNHLAKAFAVRGDILTKQGQWAKAMSDYSASIRLDPVIERALLGRCVLYRHTGQHDKAIADAQTAIKANPQSARAYAQQAMIYRDQGQFARGIDDCDRALHFQPGHAFTLRRRAMIAMGEKQFEDANDDISQAFDYDQLSAEAFALRGAAFLGRNDRARSLAYANEAVSFDPNNSSCYRIRGLIHLSQGNISTALSDADAAIRLNPRDLGAYLLRSMARMKAKQYDLAIADATVVININPKYAKAYLARSAAYRGAGKSRLAGVDRRMLQQLTAGYSVDLEDLTDIDFY